MKKSHFIIGFLSTLAMAFIFPAYLLLEPSNQELLAQGFQDRAIEVATLTYAENCALCHGPSGQGIANIPALNAEGLQGMETGDLFKIIERGIDNTQMAAWGVDEGGVLSIGEINDLIMLIQHGDWERVEILVADLGLTPPELTSFEVSDEMTALISALPNGEELSAGFTIYVDSCSACHGGDASGTTLAPALDSEELRIKALDELYRIVSLGVPGTLMAGWENALSQDEILTVLNTILVWPEILNSGIEFPQAAPASIPSSPEMIAAGSQLFNVACKTCHGLEGYGTRMAPALNSASFLAGTPDAAVFQIISGGIPETLMPAWGSRLTETEIQSLAAYIRSFEN